MPRSTDQMVRQQVRRKKLTRAVATQVSWDVTKRQINKQIKTLRCLVDQGPSVYYSSDELAGLLLPTLEMLERLSNEHRR